jgi:hypothetical protein
MLELLDEPAPFGHGFAVAPALSSAAVEHGDIARGFSDAIELGNPVSSDEADSEELDTEVEAATPSIDDLMADTADFPAETDELDFDAGAADDSPFALNEPTEEHVPAESEASEAPAFTATAPGISAASSALKRRKRQPSFIGNLIGVVGGGVVGCALAYFIVLWIGGPEKDFLELGPKLPKWMLPSSFSKSTASAAVTPMATNPTPADLEEVKQAANPDQAATPDNDPKMKINVPELPDKPAQGEDLTEAVKLPFDTQPATTDDLASELSAENGLGGTPLDVPDQVKKATANEVVKAEPKQDAAVFKAPVSYPAAELEKVLADVNQLADQVSEGEPTRKQLMNYYRKLYRLGEVATFATDANDAKQQVNALLTKLAADPSKLAEIGRNGAGFFGLDPTKQGADKGVLLAGVVETSEPAGAWHRIVLMPVGSKQAISIYSATDPGLRQGATALVLGSIVSDPQSALNEFHGQESKIVWLGASAICGDHEPSRT